MVVMDGLTCTHSFLSSETPLEWEAPVSDVFAKCREFLDRPFQFGSGTNGDRELAEAVYCFVSPPANSGPWMEIDGRKTLQFGSNDYLGLASHPAIRQRAAEVAREYGISQPMGSRLLTGTVPQHLELEAKLARFKGTQDAIVFSAGALAMMGTLAALCGHDDVLFIDENAHATLKFGAKASAATVRVFQHNDVDHLESLLKKTPVKGGRVVVVDGVYSMQGDIAPLPELVDLRRRYGFRLLVDDAHANGVFGPQGRGTPFHFGVQDEVDLHLGTFSKAFGTIGGFVAGPYEVITYLRFHAPTYIFTKALPLVVTEATSVALDLLMAADDLREKLWSNTWRLQERLREAGFCLGNTQSPITPVLAQGTKALYWSHELRGKFGIWGAPATYPAVKLGESLLRLIPTALHEARHIDYVVESLAAIEATYALGTLMPII